MIIYGSFFYMQIRTYVASTTTEKNVRNIKKKLNNQFNN